MSRAAKVLWRDLTKQYRFDDDAVAIAVLTAGLESFDRAAAAKALLDAEGVVVMDRWGQRKPHPACATERDARAAFLAAMRQLNFEKPDETPPRGPGRPPGGATAGV